MPSVTDLVEPWIQAGVLAKLDGIKICLTGTMSVKRSVIVELLAAQGAEVVNRVSQSDLLVDANAVTVTSRSGETLKQAEARRYSVPAISEDTFVSLLLGDVGLNDIRESHGLSRITSPDQLF